MDVTVKRPGSLPYKTYIEIAFGHVLDGDDYGMGQVEAAAATAANNSRAIGVLVRMLVEKGILTGADVTQLAGEVDCTCEMTLVEGGG